MSRNFFLLVALVIATPVPAQQQTYRVSKAAATADPSPAKPAQTLRPEAKREPIGKPIRSLPDPLGWALLLAVIVIAGVALRRRRGARRVVA